jgi:sporulation protein YlmC with PRC-barrel domain
MNFATTSTWTDVNPDESVSMIAATKVNGTRVYNAAGEQLGSIHDLMLNKLNGRVTYAVLSFGGFLGIGERYHPIPWNQLKYSEKHVAYIVNLDKRQLDEAPSYVISDVPDWDSPNYRSGIDSYYGAQPIAL